MDVTIHGEHYIADKCPYTSILGEIPNDVLATINEKLYMYDYTKYPIFPQILAPNADAKGQHPDP